MRLGGRCAGSTNLPEDEFVVDGQGDVAEEVYGEIRGLGPSRDGVLGVDSTIPGRRWCQTGSLGFEIIVRLLGLRHDDR